jgi:hypothetical protein
MERMPSGKSIGPGIAAMVMLLTFENTESIISV